MLQRVSWAKLIATGPENPLHNQHNVFCMICGVIVSMRARGFYQKRRLYQYANGLRQYRRCREKNFPEAVRGKGARILYGDRLVAECKIYVDWEVPELDQKRAFFWWVRGQAILIYQCGLSCTEPDSNVDDLSKAGGHLWMLDELWTQVGFWLRFVLRLHISTGVKGISP